MSASQDDNPPLDWRIDVPLLTEPLYLKGYALAIVLSVTLMGSLLSFLALVTDNAEAIGPMWMLSGIAMAVIVVLGGLGTALLTGNRMKLGYTADARGVVQVMLDRKLRAASGVAVAAGVLGGSAGTAGAGLIARSQQRRSVAWQSIVAARFHPGRRAVSLRNSWRTVLIVFCSEEVYEPFVMRVKAHLAQRPAGEKARNPVPGLLFRTVVAILGSLPFFVMPWPFELDLFVPLLALCFVLAGVWLVPLLVLVAFGGHAWMWFDLVGRLYGEHESMFDTSSYVYWDTMTFDDWIPLGVAAAGTLVILLLGLGLLRGRYQSALEDDGIEDGPDEEAEEADDRK